MADQIITDGHDDPQHPLWNAPTITAPQPNTTVSPGFSISANTGAGTVPFEWTIQIMQGPTLLKEVNLGREDVGFRYSVPTSLIPPGAAFYFKVDYYIPPFWSRWAWSGDLLMAASTSTVEITNPVNGTILTTRTPLLHGIGHPGARLEVYEADSGVIVHAFTTVKDDGSWDAKVTEPLRSGPFRLIAGQNVGEATWSNVVDVVVR